MDVRVQMECMIYGVQVIRGHRRGLLSLRVMTSRERMGLSRHGK